MTDGGTKETAFVNSILALHSEVAPLTAHTYGFPYCCAIVAVAEPFPVNALACN